MSVCPEDLILLARARQLHFSGIERRHALEQVLSDAAKSRKYGGFSFILLDKMQKKMQITHALKTCEHLAADSQTC